MGKFELVKHKSKTDKSIVLFLQHNFKCSVKTSFTSQNFIFFSDKIDFAKKSSKQARKSINPKRVGSTS